MSNTEVRYRPRRWRKEDRDMIHCKWPDNQTMLVVYNNLDKSFWTATGHIKPLTEELADDEPIHIEGYARTIEVAKLEAMRTWEKHFKGKT